MKISLILLYSLAILVLISIAAFGAIAFNGFAAIWITVSSAFLLLLVLGAIRKMRRTVLQLDALTSRIPCGTYQYDAATGKITWINHAFATLFGYRQEEILPAIHGQYENLIHPEDVSTVRLIEQAQLKRGKRIEVEHRAIKKNGDIIWILKKGEIRKTVDANSYYCVLIDISKQKMVEQSLQTSSRRYKIAVEQSDHIVFDYDPVNRRAHHPEKAILVYGLPKYIENVPQSLLDDGMVHPDFSDQLTLMYQQIHEGQKQATCTVKIRRLDGTYAWNHISLTSIFDDQGNLLRVVGVIDDITRQKEMEQGFEKEKQYRHAILSDSLFTYEVNISQDKLLNFPEHIARRFSIHPTASYTKLLESFCESALFPEDAIFFMQKFSITAIRHSYNAGINEISAEYRFSDTGLWALAAMHLFEDTISHEIKAIAYMKDIDKQKKSTLYLKTQAERDTLTGLYNKGMTQHLISAALSSPASTTPIHAFFIVDIDNFKDINDTFGHLYGDAVLSEIAEKLKVIFSADDIIGRIGGDEFAVFLKDIGSLAIIEEKAFSVNQALRICYMQHKVEHRISASIGIAISPAYGTTFEALYKNADIALYQSKNKGKDTYTLYSGENFSEYQSNRTKVDHFDSLLKQSFKSNISEYIFRILYSSTDKGAAINSVLELIGKHYNVSRGYIFENSPDNIYTSNTFEWCNEGISPQLEQLQEIPLNVLDIYQANANAHGFYIMRSLNDVPNNLREILEPQGIKSMMHFSIRENDICRGFIGFDDCKEERSPSTEEIHALFMVTNIIGSFLLKMRTAETVEQNEKALITILNSLNSYTYVIEPGTYRLLFINAQTLSVAPETRLGNTCYHSFYSADSPCENCPINQLSPHDFSCKHTMDIYNTQLAIWTSTTASWLTWTNGKKAYLINCVDISEYKNALAAVT